jgi:hypothetical protein
MIFAYKILAALTHVVPGRSTVVGTQEATVGQCLPGSQCALVLRFRKRSAKVELGKCGHATIFPSYMSRYQLPVVPYSSSTF